MIEVTRVSKRFDRVLALDGVSLSIASGERVALVGANGSGKTTLMRAMLGLLRVTGTVTIAGIDVARAPQHALMNVAYIPQIAPPIDAPVGEVVRVFASLRKKPIEAVSTRARALTLDLPSIERTRFRDLSGGMRQKLLAAMALAAEAPILVCDEPTANLDVDAREAFFAEVDARPEAATLVICSHRADEVKQRVDRIVTLREGTIVEDRPIVSVRHRPPVRLRCVRAS